MIKVATSNLCENYDNHCLVATTIIISWERYSKAWPHIIIVFFINVSKGARWETANKGFKIVFPGDLESF